MKTLFYSVLSFFVILLSSCLKNSSCNQFNIDSFELTTGIDIPRTSKVDCNENDSLRISLFYVDVSNARFLELYGSMQGYVDEYKMDRIRRDSLLPLSARFLLPELPTLSDTTLYRAEGVTRKGTEWRYLVFLKEKLIIAEMDAK